jgi:hypothetical protein
MYECMYSYLLDRLPPSGYKLSAIPLNQSLDGIVTALYTAVKKHPRFKLDIHSYRPLTAKCSSHDSMVAFNVMLD